MANKNSVDVAREALEEQRMQQAQNVGIQLYAYRMGVIRDIEASRLEDAFAEAKVLFSESVARLVDDYEDAEHKRALARAEMDSFIEDLRVIAPKTYSKYLDLRATQNLQRPEFQEETEKKVEKLFEQLELNNPEYHGSKPICVWYRELNQMAKETGIRSERAKKALFEMMRHEIKASMGA